MIELTHAQRTSQPYLNIGVMFVTWADGTETTATCSLVGRNDILTATHCVFNPDKGGWASSFNFYFGTDYNPSTGQFESILSQPVFGQWNATAWTNQAFTDGDHNTMLQSEVQYDVALIGIDNPIGDSLGWLGLDAGYNGNASAVAVGYPVGSTGMMMDNVNVSKSPDFGIYESSSYIGPGSSGGPLLEGNHVIGVKSTGSQWADLGSSFIYDELVAKMSENDSLISSDTTAPTVSIFSPSDEASGVVVGSNIVVTFSEDIQRGTGNIVLKTVFGTTVATYNAATSTNLSISGNTLTINPTSDLAPSTGYKVEFSNGTIRDLAGNSYLGTASYNFVTEAGPEHPDLTPYQPSEWSDKIVVTTNAGSTVDSSAVYSDQSLYLDWAIYNKGTAGANSTFYTHLYLDGVYQANWYTDSLAATCIASVDDYALGTLSAGTHTLRIVTDASESIAEENEYNNEYAKTITVMDRAATSGNATFFSSSGDDIIAGGGGIDTVVFSSTRASHSLSKSMSGWTVSSITDGTDTLTSIERLQFSDKTIALDLTTDGNAGQAMEFIGAVAPDLLNNTSIRGLIISLFDQGQTMESLSQLALDLNLLPTKTNVELANAVYHNVLGGTASTEMTDALVDYIESHSQANFLATVAGLHINVDLVGLQQTGIEYLI